MSLTPEEKAAAKRGKWFGGPEFGCEATGEL